MDWDLMNEFKREKMVDILDTEFVGKFPYFNSRRQKWGYIGRGLGWKMYAEWLENKIINQKK